ncbi:hypothetical protein CON22_18030 [Bacillus cereus]|nr:hypothetical protein CON22_18030 [Bacillus cereus]
MEEISKKQEEILKRLSEEKNKDEDKVIQNNIEEEDKLKDLTEEEKEELANKKKREDNKQQLAELEKGLAELETSITDTNVKIEELKTLREEEVEDNTVNQESKEKVEDKAISPESEEKAEDKVINPESEEKAEDKVINRDKEEKVEGDEANQYNLQDINQTVKALNAPYNFPDVPGWAKEHIGYLFSKNVLTGLPDGTFSPNLEMDRGSAATIMAKILKLPVDPNAKPSFKDSQKHWSTPYIAAVEKAGVIKGEGNGNFNPSGKLTRASMASMLVNAYKLDGKVQGNIPTGFNDLKGHWGERYVNTLVALGITTGYEDNTWKPDKAIIRSEAASLVARADISKDKEVKTIYMPNNFFTYNGPSLSSGISLEYAPQTVTVYEERPGNWIKIHTGLGYKWALSKEKTHYMPNEFFTYDNPSNSANVITKYSPQTVTVVEEKGTWLRIRTKNGLQWLNTQEPRTIVDDLKTVRDNKQIILVTSKGYGTNTAQIRTFENYNGKWKQLKDVNGYIGRDGFAENMSESVVKSPRGKYTIGMAFGRYDNPGTKLQYHRIRSNDVWVDDSNSPYYNTLQQTPANGRWRSAEKMNIPAYDYGFVINYNQDRIPGKGSAIFFHVSNMWTAGCTGVTKQNVIDIIKWIDPAKNPVIIQTPENELINY